MAVTNPAVEDITADTLLAQSKPKLITNFDDLLENDVDIEARLTTAESDITGKSPIANPTFTGTVRSPKVVITPDGGIAISLINKTGAASVKGTVVSTSSTTDNAFMAQASELDSIGVVYESGIADAAACLVVVAGIADVLLKDGTASTRNHFVFASATDGRAETKAVPANIDEHFKEIGHCLESKIAGTDVLFKCVLHFN